MYGMMDTKAQGDTSAVEGQVPSGGMENNAAGDHTVLGEPAAGNGLQGAGTAQPQPLDITFPDEMPVAKDVLENYQNFCTECGMSSEQAQKAVDFYMQEHVRQLDVEKEFSMNMLKNGAWKGQFEQRLAVANTAVRALDAKLGGRLIPVLESGLGNNHVFAEMMAYVGEMLQEDSFLPHGGGVAASRSMSTEEFLRSEVFSNR